TRLFALALLGSLFLVSGCTALLVGGAAAGGYYVGKDERTTGEIADDGVITAAVKSKFIGDDLVKARNINVDTYRRVVTLVGTVDSAAARDRAISLARSVNNVARVVADELVVK